MEIKIKNYTPHPVNIIDVDGKEIATFLPESQPIRLQSETVRTGTFHGVPITKTVFGDPEGLPEPQTGVLFVVSQIVKSALPDRADLAVPAEVVRDETGQIIGCRSLGI